MEPRDRINGADPTQPQILFALRDPATGIVRPIRDMTDEELVRHKTNALKELAQQQSTMSDAMMRAAMEAAQAIAQVKSLIAVINYEAHRRSISIVIPH